MAFEEDKIIKEIENESEGLKDYDSFIRSNTEFRYKKQQQKLIFATILAIIYLILSLGFLFTFRNNTSLLLWPFKVSDSDKISNLQNQINSLNNQVSELKTNISTSTTEVVSTKKLDARLTALEESISLDPEKAVTAILIREQQKNLTENFKELKDSQVRLSDKVDSFITSVIIVPIIGFLLALLGWFIQVRLSKKNN